MKKSIAFISGKGGTGKSLIVANLGIALAKQGKKVLLIDGNIGNRGLDLLLRCDSLIIDNIADVLSGRNSLLETCISIDSYEDLSLLPSSQTKDSSIVTEHSMKELIKSAESAFDYILIDCPSGFENGIDCILKAVDTSIVVTLPDPSSVRAADKSFMLLRNYHIMDASFILNRYPYGSSKQDIFVSIEEIQELLPYELLGIIPEDHQVTVSNYKDLNLMESDSLFGQSITNICNRMEDPELPLLKFETNDSILNRLSKLFR